MTARRRRTTIAGAAGVAAAIALIARLRPGRTEPQTPVEEPQTEPLSDSERLELLERQLAGMQDRLSQLAAVVDTTSRRRARRGL